MLRLAETEKCFATTENLLSKELPNVKVGRDREMFATTGNLLSKELLNVKVGRDIDIYGTKVNTTSQFIRVEQIIFLKVTGEQNVRVYR